MSSFVRPAEWLRQLFTQSRTSWTHPSQVSNDVSLVQPYDGGGLSFQARYFTVAPAAGLTGTAILTTIPANSVFRLLGIEWETTAGAGTPVCRVLAEDMLGSQCAICTNHTFGTALNRPESPDNIMGKVLGPSTIIRFEYFAAGDAATVVSCTIYGILAPQGTVFYV